MAKKKPLKPKNEVCFNTDKGRICETLSDKKYFMQSKDQLARAVDGTFKEKKVISKSNKSWISNTGNVDVKGIDDGSKKALENEDHLSVLKNEIALREKGISMTNIDSVCHLRKDGNKNVTANKEIENRIIKALKKDSIDLCETFAGTYFCRLNMGVERKKMPQFEPLDTRKFIESLSKEGIKKEEGLIESCKLKPTQTQLQTEKIKLKLKTLEMANGNLNRVRTSKNLNKKFLGFIKIMAKPVIISKDNYILDGHHKWASILAFDFLDRKDKAMKVRYTKINLPIKKLYKKAVESEFVSFSKDF